MIPQTYIPPAPDYATPSTPSPVSQQDSEYGKQVFQVVPDGKGGHTLIETRKGEPVSTAQAYVDGLSEILAKYGAPGGKAEVQQVPARYLDYPVQATIHGSEWSLVAKSLLAALIIYIGFRIVAGVIGGIFQLIGSLMRGAWWLVRLPFRVVGHVLGAVVRGPRRAARSMRYAGRRMSAGMGRTYTAFADSFNSETTRHLKQEHMRHVQKKMRKMGVRMQVFSDNLGRKLAACGMPGETEAATPPPRPTKGNTGRFGWPTPPPRRGERPEFNGYRVLDELPRGGSGAYLYLAEPRSEHKRSMRERGVELPDRVVIKSFSVQSGAHVSGILREGRALDAAKRLGQVLEHEASGDGLYYVMPFVPGVTLDEFMERLHGQHPDPHDGRALSKGDLQRVLALTLDLTHELERFHGQGLWHKDIKPGNLIVDGNRMHVVDLGLLTPLASALTLTTHGTEYYRDPEMVRLAMRGTQVRDVDAAKFDIYSAGAVLFSMLEGTFPAHGNLSRLSRPVPPAVAWVVRRAMSEHASRYASAAEMSRDVAFLLDQRDLSAVKPHHLPSSSGEPMPMPMPAEAAATVAPAAFAAAPESFEPQPTGWKARRAERRAQRTQRREERKAKVGTGRRWFATTVAAGLVAFGATMVASESNRAANASRQRMESRYDREVARKQREAAAQLAVRNLKLDDRATALAERVKQESPLPILTNVLLSGPSGQDGEALHNRIEAAFALNNMRLIGSVDSALDGSDLELTAGWQRLLGAQNLDSLPSEAQVASLLEGFPSADLIVHYPGDVESEPVLYYNRSKVEAQAASHQ